MKRNIIIIPMVLSMLFSLGVRASTMKRCIDLLRTFTQSAPKSDFGNWDVNTVKDLKAEDFLPHSFVKELEQKVGPLKVRIENKYTYNKPIQRLGRVLRLVENNSDFDDQSYFEMMSISIGSDIDSHIVECLFIVDPERPNFIYLTGLEINNPLNQFHKLHFSQSSKGFPFPVFKHLRQRLFQFLRNGNYHYLLSTPQTYAVAMLYTKLVGFKPSSEKSIATYQLLEEYYQIAKNEFPASYQFKKLDDMNLALGDHRKNASERPYSKIEEIEKALAEQTPIKDAHYFYKGATLIAVLLNLPNNYQNKIYFIDPKNQTKILNWKDLLRDGQLGMEFNLWDN